MKTPNHTPQRASSDASLPPMIPSPGAKLSSCCQKTDRHPCIYSAPYRILATRPNIRFSHRSHTSDVQQAVPWLSALQHHRLLFDGKSAQTSGEGTRARMLVCTRPTSRMFDIYRHNVAFYGSPLQESRAFGYEYLNDRHSSVTTVQ